MQLDKHPILKQHYELCIAIEEFPAHEDQTNLIIKASELGEAIERHIDKHGLHKKYDFNA